MKTQVWQNVTTSSNWDRTPVGIVRVEVELARRLNVRYFTYSHGEIREVSFPNTNAQEPIPEISFAVDGKPIGLGKIKGFLDSKTNLSRSSRLLTSASLLVSVFYGKNRSFDRFIISVSAKSLKVLRHLEAWRIKSREIPIPANVVELFQNQQLSKKISHPFKPGDTIFTAGLDWDYNLLDVFSDIKNEIPIHIIAAVYDLIPVNEPHFLFSDRHSAGVLRHLVKIAENADLVITNCEVIGKEFDSFTKKLSLPLVHRKVIKLAAMPTEVKSEPVFAVQMWTNNSSFVLCVGTFEIRKNYDLIIRAVYLAAEKGLAIPKIVIAGGVGWLTSDVIHRLETDHFLKKKILFLRNPSDSKLKWLYEQCSGLLNPSFSEGFGLPCAEASFYHKPLILSDIATYRELFPKANFFSPHNPFELVNSLRSFGTENIDETFATRTWDEVSSEFSEVLVEFN